jgi:hypothetical protein
VLGRRSEGRGAEGTCGQAGPGNGARMFHHDQYAPPEARRFLQPSGVRPRRTKCGWLAVTPLPRLGGPLRPADQLRPERSMRPRHGVKWGRLQSKFVSVSQRLRNSDRGRRRFPGQASEGQGGRHSPGCTPVDPDDRLGRRAQWLREQ